jgi:Secretion system C-terminal sorting domain
MSKITHYLLLSACLLATLSLKAVNYSFNVTNGNWNVNTNWLPIGVPTTGDNVTIASGKTVSLNIAGVSINNLTVSGKLSGANDLAVAGNFDINAVGAEFSVDGTVSIAGTFTFSNGTLGNFSNATIPVITVTGLGSLLGGTKTLSKTKLVLNGGANWTEGGNISLTNSSIFEISQNFNINTSVARTITGTASTLFNVKGTLNKQVISQQLSVNAPFKNDGTINIAEGTFAIQNTYSGNGSISVGAGMGLGLSATAGINYTNASFTNNGTVSGNALNFTGTTLQTVDGTGSISNLTVNNANNLSVLGTQTIAAITLTNGKLQLTDNNLIANGTITGMSTTNYIQTNGLGKLQRNVGTTNVLFPIGKTTYTPVTINQVAGVGTFAAQVKDGIDATYELDPNHMVSKIWDISRLSSNIDAATIKTEWNSATDQGPSFVSASAQLMHYSGTTWDLLPTAARTVSCASGVCSLTQTGVTAFSPFAVGMPSAFPITYTFTGAGGSTLWSLPANWSPNGVPNSVVSNVIINQFLVVNNIAGATVRNLTINGGNLLYTNEFTVVRNLNINAYYSTVLGWTGGILDGSSNVNIGGDFTCLGCTLEDFYHGTQASIIVSGMANISAAETAQSTLVKECKFRFRNLFFNGGGSINPTTGGVNKSCILQDCVLEIPTGQTLIVNNPLKEGNASFSTINVNGSLIYNNFSFTELNGPINNTGTIETNGSGTFKLAGGISTGVFRSNSNSTISFNGASHTLTGSKFEGNGTIYIGTTVNISDAIFNSLVNKIKISYGDYINNQSISTLTQGLLNLSGSFNHTGNLELFSSIPFASPGLTTIGGSLKIGNDITDAIFAPLGNVAIGGNLELNGCTIGSLSTVFGTTMTVAGLTTFNIGNHLIRNKQLILNGGGTWTAGKIDMDGNAILEIPATKTFTVNTGVNAALIEPLGTFDIKGILRKQGTSPLTVNLPINNTGEISIEEGTMTINGQNPAMTNFYLGNGSINVATGAILNANWLNYSNALLTNNGTIGTTNLAGNAITFNGAAAQTIAGNGSINNIKINNVAGVTLSGAQTVANSLVFTSGKLKLVNSDVTVGTTITGANATNYVQTNGTGNLKRSVSTADIAFPVGKTTYTPITINQASGTDDYTVRVRDGIDPTHPLLGIGAVTKEWNISRTTGNTTAATIKAEWTSTTDEGIGFACATARLLHHNGTIWEALPASGTTTTCATGVRSLTKTGVTTFSPFAVGVATAVVLPLELLDFKAINNKSTIDLLWQTASEKDVSHFDIEQSTDAKIFSKIGETKAKGSASDYQFTTKPPTGAGGYFRLKMVDLNGDFTYSKVVSLAFGKDLSATAYPNPVRNELTIDAFSEGKFLNIEVLDVLGRSIYQKRAQNTEGSKLLIVNTLTWNSGIYFLKITDGKTVFQQKVVKE